MASAITFPLAIALVTGTSSRPASEHFVKDEPRKSTSLDAFPVSSLETLRHLFLPQSHNFTMSASSDPLVIGMRLAALGGTFVPPEFAADLIQEYMVDPKLLVASSYEIEDMPLSYSEYQFNGLFLDE